MVTHVASLSYVNLKQPVKVHLITGQAAAQVEHGKRASIANRRQGRALRVQAGRD